MSEPLIRCIMPTCNRETMAKRAIRCFDAQSPRALLVVMNQGGKYEQLVGDRVTEVHCPILKGRSVGHIRNEAIEHSWGFPALPDYIAHFDDDDISAPNRLQRQLEHIQKTGKLVTGFYNMPMYDLKNDKVWIYTNPHPSYSLGNCLFYKREAWERVKFPDMTPEDNLWRKNIGGENIEPRSVFEPDGSPLMIQVVHGANASASIIRSSVYYKEPSEAQEKTIRELLASA